MEKQNQDQTEGKNMEQSVCLASQHRLKISSQASQCVVWDLQTCPGEGAGESTFFFFKWHKYFDSQADDCTIQLKNKWG